MNNTKDIYFGFHTLEGYMKSENHINKTHTAQNLVEHLINKIKEKSQIKSVIQERGDNAIIFVPVSLIEEGRAKKGMKDKNIITVWYFTNRIDIEIEDRNNKEQCFLNEDINDETIERIYSIYQNIK